MTRSVVITADDFGRDLGTNETIAALLAEGHISATTLITVSPSAADALRRIDLVPHLHVTLTSERGLPRWSPLGGASRLTDPDGSLTDDLLQLSSRCTPTDAIAEADAQLGWMRRRGLTPVAADSHSGTLYGLHGGPWAGQILAATLQWCARHQLAFRLPRDPALYFGATLPAPLAHLHEQAVGLADELGVVLPQAIATNRRTAADLGSYEALRDGYLRCLSTLPEGTSEVFLHPSQEGAVAGPDGILRVWEARLLRDPKWHDALDAEDISVVALPR